MKIKQILIALVASVSLPVISLANYQTERITNFSSDINIDQSSQITVKETIKYYFPSEKHGIYRYIPYAYYDNAGKKFYLKVSDASVSRDGLTEEYSQSFKDDNFVLNIGDKNKTISGEHTYQITYKLLGAINYFDDHDELYWNVTGNDWAVPIDNVVANVSIPQGEPSVKCFTGLYGKTTENCQAKSSAKSASFTANEPLTIVVGVQKGILAVTDKNYSQISSFISQKGWKTIILMFIMPLLIPIYTFIYCIRLIKKNGRDLGVKHISIVPEFAPPEGVRPAEMGTILDEKVDSRDLTAEIIKLASLGYILIEEIKGKFLAGNDYKLTLIKDLGSECNDYERQIVKTIFRGSKDIKISQLKNRSTGQKDWQIIRDSVYNEMKKRGFFVEDPQKVRGKYIITGIVFVFIGLFTFVFGSLGISLVISGIIIMITSGFMPQRTAKGTELLNQIKGFKMFISQAEKYRSKWAEKENLFFDFLPYAVLFGVTDKWAKAFEGMDIAKPNWYVGNWTTFNAIAFSHSLNSFSNNFVSTTTTAASTGKSGFSSGGGFSGGGFGGGGGGSW